MLRKQYFIWLLLYGAAWVLAAWEFTFELNERQLVGLCLFLTCLFVLPLFRSNPIWQTVLSSVQALSTLLVFYPADNGLNPYALLIQALVIGEASFRLPPRQSLAVMLLQLGVAAWLALAANLSASELAWTGLFYLLLGIAMLYHQAIHRRERDVQLKNDALLHEYRIMKRQLVMEEEQARRDERMLIAHEIHDSVGHKLTALLIQVEAFRLRAAERDRPRIDMLKELAEQSLEETRQAVKSFKHREAGGLQGVIRLIRKLEMESFMKISFTVRHGAFAAPLSGEQSFAIYRAVQEALTNIMKHSVSREAQVSFESPGGSIVRFEVVNPVSPDLVFQEGYGLKAMRERLEKVGGSLEIAPAGGRFVVRGNIRLNTKWREWHDQGVAGGGSSDGASRAEGHDRNGPRDQSDGGSG